MRKQVGLGQKLTPMCYDLRRKLEAFISDMTNNQRIRKKTKEKEKYLEDRDKLK